ncbi:MAG: hypothetical protein QF486_04970 [Candidatus Woesearchaeota archaeon]|jgi:hypothetical protein|nr:hypothetical protein [Candidatus Woesearchaeota archaeon]MDP7182007.1 hypothetical protein [Candidatus Woesearchaeota archaeon]MDP7198941.1 hypothetical protein [Candidatus Woesearchaeota archaeon]MDP7467319.1 hypothetical protein [Candidatus Woesearchaeota archaeon]MDP7646626.1 hypothetical protein [Candidatus Woesearchaeota archaeon]|tara:strand:- start:109 stop:396 length:288 start_codon:yes stop_codon:yes gene_type:complete
MSEHHASIVLLVVGLLAVGLVGFNLQGNTTGYKVAVFDTIDGECIVNNAQQLYEDFAAENDVLAAPVNFCSFPEVKSCVDDERGAVEYCVAYFST